MLYPTFCQTFQSLRVYANEECFLILASENRLVEIGYKNIYVRIE